MKKKHSRPESPVSSESKKKTLNKKLALFLVFGTLTTSLLYFWLVTVSEVVMHITVITYWVLAGLAIIAYFIYNRGLVGSDEVTAEMLPDSMSWAEKKEYLDNIAERKRKSSSLLAVFFIFLVPITLDLMKLFVVDYLLEGLL